MSEEKPQNLLWNSEFRVDVSMVDKQPLKYIPQYIYGIKPPAIQLMPTDDEFNPETGVFDSMSLTVRCDKDKLVVDEILSTLCTDWFDISLYAPKDTLVWEFKKCSLEKFVPYEFVSKKKYDSPYNIDLPITTKTVIYYGHGVKYIYGEDEEKVNVNE